MAKIEKRSEIVFLYDVSLCNPNGDPMDANRPRIDESTGKCLVTDVRLKRTIRDYLFEKGYNGKDNSIGDIFIRDEDGIAITGAKRAESYENKTDFLNKFIDARLFGAVSAPKGKATESEESDFDSDSDEVQPMKKTKTKVPKGESKTFHLTGAVQFGMGKSLNVVKENFIKGTGAFATAETSSQKTFREEYNITYGLIGFHGVVNESAAQYTNCSEEDVKELVEGMWNGTKNLLTRSKKGHMPRLLIKIDYSEKGFFIGDLVERLKLTPNEGYKLEDLSDISEYTIDTRELNNQLEKYQDKIEKIHITIDDRVKLSDPIFQK